MAGAAVLPAAAQSADTGAEPRAGVYLPEYFRAAAPANAYDMVLRLPGFTLVEADADVRGFASASGNVLFDGVRPTSKREGTAQQLKRIPASAVERIELIHAGAPGVDMGGYPVLANIVRHQEANTEWAAEAGAVASTDGWAEPRTQLEYGRRWDDRALDLSFKYEPELDDDSGRGSIVSHSPADPIGEYADWDTRTVQHNSEIGASWRQPFASGRLTLTAAMRGEDAQTRNRQDGRDGSQRIDEYKDFDETELGMRFVRQFGGRTTLEAMASRQRGRLRDVENSHEGEDHEHFEENTDTGESIGRIDLTHAYTDRLSFNAGLEVAINRLESDNRLQENGIAVPLPGSRVRIEERRAEVSSGATWRPREDWSIEAGMRLERSDISQTGDSPLERRFTYPKPRIAVRWMPGEADQWRFSLSREVGQLKFNDFAASASLDSGTVSAGNAELQPDRIWRTIVGWEHHFNSDTALTLSWIHDRITGVVDRVLVFDGDDVFDAPGNIGDGRRDTLQLDLSAPLDGIGFRGGHVRASLLYTDSRVTDPVTGERRRISEDKPVDGEIELGQDLPARRASWGLKLEHIAEHKVKYRFDQVERKSEDMGWILFAERRIGANWRLRGEATDLFGREFRKTRDKYDGPRSQVPLEEREVRKRKTPGTFQVTLRREFSD